MIAMASSRPRHIDLPQNSSLFDPNRLKNPSPCGEVPPSPRSGEVPPALSPLDAFALQGRLLAAKFEDEDGKRLSRLPPMTVANQFSRARPNYFSRPFQNGDQHAAPQPEPPGSSPELSRQKNKHTSFYPSIHGHSNSSGSLPDMNSFEKPALAPVSEERSPEMNGEEHYALSRTMSPELLPSEFAETSRIDFVPQPPQKTSTGESTRSNLSSGYSLVPPARSPFGPPRSPRGQPSVRSVRMDSGDDSDALSFQSDPYDLTSYHRKPSLRSMRDRPRSPFSPTLNGRRSPSISSEISNPDSQQAPRRSMNFSRPISPAMRMQKHPSIDSRPSFEQSAHLATAESPPVRPSVDGFSFVESNPDLETPSHPWADDNVSSHLTDDEKPVEDNTTSYTYSKYALPRGRKVVSNGSFKAQSWLAHQFEWDHPTLESPQADGQQKQDQFSHSAPGEEPDFTLERQPTLPTIDDLPSPDPEPSKASLHKPQASFNDYIGKLPPEPPEPPEPERPSAGRSRSYDDGMARPIGVSRFHEEGIAQPLPPPPVPEKVRPSPPPKSISSSPAAHRNQQLEHERPALRRKSEEKGRKSSEKKRNKDPFKDTHTPTPDQVPAEDHLAKGIELHESGNVQKATYHLRIAARAGLPSAMLLYALACRHGWGMRPNQQEAVLWLRKAVDISRLEVDQEAPDHLLPPTFAGPQNAARQRQRKAQLALSIYELGVSYLNGWGIQQDKVLALRCFEIAAGWGDADALSEAGFCYAKAVGCKKDLAKAAGYYRRAEHLGVSMAGNSW